VPKLFEKELSKRVNIESRNEDKNTDSEDLDNWYSEEEHSNKKK